MQNDTATPANSLAFLAWSKSLGLKGTIGSVGTLVGSVVGGWLLQAYGDDGAAIMYRGGAVLMFASMVMYLLADHHLRKRQSAESVDTTSTVKPRHKEWGHDPDSPSVRFSATISRCAFECNSLVSFDAVGQLCRWSLTCVAAVHVAGCDLFNMGWLVPRCDGLHSTEQKTAQGVAKPLHGQPCRTDGFQKRISLGHTVVIRGITLRLEVGMQRQAPGTKRHGSQAITQLFERAKLLVLFGRMWMVTQRTIDYNRQYFISPQPFLQRTTALHPESHLHLLPLLEHRQLLDESAGPQKLSWFEARAQWRQQRKQLL